MRNSVFAIGRISIYFSNIFELFLFNIFLVVSAHDRRDIVNYFSTAAKRSFEYG